MHNPVRQRLKQKPKAYPLTRDNKKILLCVDPIYIYTHTQWSLLVDSHFFLVFSCFLLLLLLCWAWAKELTGSDLGAFKAPREKGNGPNPERTLTLYTHGAASCFDPVAPAWVSWRLVRKFIGTTGRGQCLFSSFNEQGDGLSGA